MESKRNKVGVGMWKEGQEEEEEEWRMSSRMRRREAKTKVEDFNLR